MHIKDIDLNLLNAFEALMTERSVGRAAVRLGVGQPAASHALGRLRILLADDLFVRRGRAMEPTERALALAEPIGRALAVIREAFEPLEPFDPPTSKRTFRLSGGDYALSVILPALLPLVRQQAPGVDLRFRFVEKDRVFDLLEEGVLDIALGVFPDPAKRFEVTTVFEERFVCIARRDHPAFTKGLDLDSYAKSLHLLVTERGDERGAMDEALQSLGRSRRIMLTVPSVLAAKRLLLHSDLIATTGERAAKALLRDPDLTTAPTPVKTPGWKMQIIRMRRIRSDPAVIWLCDQILKSQPRIK